MAFDASSARAILRSFDSEKVRARVVSRKGLEVLAAASQEGGLKVDRDTVRLLRDLFGDASPERVEWEVLALGFQRLSEEFRSFFPLFASSSSDSSSPSDYKGGSVGEIASIVLGLLQNGEPRLRNLVCDKLSSLPILLKMGAGAEAELGFVNATIEPLLDDIEKNGLVREQTTRPTTLGSEENIPLDDTTGWGNLETHVRALHSIWKGCSRHVVWSCVRPEGQHSSRINNIVLKTLSDNPNRYVREECLNLISTLCDTLRKAPSPADLEACAKEEEDDGDGGDKEVGKEGGENGENTPAGALGGAETPIGAGGGTVRTIGMGVVSLRKESEHSTTEAYDQGSSSAVQDDDDDMFSFRTSSPSSSSSSGNSGAVVKSAGSAARAASKRKNKTRRPAASLPLFTPSLSMCPHMCAAVEKGLQDEWSQIRLAATGAARAFLGALLEGQNHKRGGGGGGGGGGGALSITTPIPAVSMPHPVLSHPIPGAGLDPAPGRGSVQDWTALLKAIYAKHNPEKVGQVPQILQQFRGRERFMLKKLQEKYPDLRANREVEAALSLSSGGSEGGPRDTDTALPMPPPEPRARIPAPIPATPVDLAKNSSGSAASMFRDMLGGTGARARARGSETPPVREDAPSLFLAAYPELLPRLCMNRFYAAEGVRQAAHQAWRFIMGAQGGVSLLSGNIERVAAYYSEQTKSNSHMVSEAALHAIKELSTRLSRSDVVKVLPLLVETLGACVQDHSWPVRDAAVGALGSLVGTFAAEISDMEAAGSLIIPGVDDYSNDVDGEGEGEGPVAVLLRVCSSQLTDTIASVRDTAAVALANLCAMRGCDAYRAQARAAAVSHLQKHLVDRERERSGAAKKPAPSFLPQGMVDAAIAAKRMEAEPQEQEQQDKRLKWRRGGGWGCCLDCMEVRDGSPQDAEEGCVSLLEEMAPGRVRLEASEALCKLVAGRYPAHLSLFEEA